jgi:D-3-phosphoglycerate dehydrogenase
MVSGSLVVSRTILEAAPRLRLVMQHGRGTDLVDVAAAQEKGIAVAHVPGANSVAVAELALALILHLAKRLAFTDDIVRARKKGVPVSMELAGRTLAIVGLGASGTELATRARALGMRILATRAAASPPPHPSVDFVGGPEALPEVLAEADVVSLHLPLGPKTREIVDDAALRRMKPTAYLVNTARAALVDYTALVDALRHGRLAGAAFDVFWSEPADPADPILALPNFVLTPHVAGFSDAAIERVTDAIADNLARLEAGRPLVNVLPPST